MSEVETLADMYDMIEWFVTHTSGGRAAGHCLLREHTFCLNTGRWPDHLPDRRWRTYDFQGEQVTWERAK